MTRGQQRMVDLAELVAVRDDVLSLQATLRDECATYGTDCDREQLTKALEDALCTLDQVIGNLPTPERVCEPGRHRSQQEVNQ